MKFIFCILLVALNSCSNHSDQVRVNVQGAVNALKWKSNQSQQTNFQFCFSEREDPFYELDQILISYQGEFIIIDKDFLSSSDVDLFFVDLEPTPVFISHTENGFLLSYSGGDGAGSFEVTFLIENQKVIQRKISGRDIKNSPLISHYLPPKKINKNHKNKK